MRINCVWWYGRAEKGLMGDLRGDNSSGTVWAFGGNLLQELVDLKGCWRLEFARFSSYCDHLVVIPHCSTSFSPGRIPLTSTGSSSPTPSYSAFHLALLFVVVLNPWNPTACVLFVLVIAQNIRQRPPCSWGNKLIFVLPLSLEPTLTYSWSQDICYTSKQTDPINLPGVTNLVPSTSSYKLKAFYHQTFAAIQVSLYTIMKVLAWSLTPVWPLCLGSKSYWRDLPSHTLIFYFPHPSYRTAFSRFQFQYKDWILT